MESINQQYKVWRNMDDNFISQKNIFQWLCRFDLCIKETKQSAWREEIVGKLETITYLLPPDNHIFRKQI